MPTSLGLGPNATFSIAVLHGFKWLSASEKKKLLTQGRVLCNLKSTYVIQEKGIRFQAEFVVPLNMCTMPVAAEQAWRSWEFRSLTF